MNIFKFNNDAQKALTPLQNVLTVISVILILTIAMTTNRFYQVGGLLVIALHGWQMLGKFRRNQKTIELLQVNTDSVSVHFAGKEGDDLSMTCPVDQFFTVITHSQISFMRSDTSKLIGKAYRTSIVDKEQWLILQGLLRRYLSVPD